MSLLAGIVIFMIGGLFGFFTAALMYVSGKE